MLRRVSGASFVAFTLIACHAFAAPRTLTKVAVKPGAVVPAAATPQPKMSPKAELIHGPGLLHVALVPSSKLCPTEGKLLPAGGLVHVDVGSMRAFVSTDRSHTEQLEFTYRGPSKDAAPLADGELRRQIGIKLKAQDACNVIYAMWHIAPTSGIFVSVKRNRGMSTSAACKDGGYIFVNPTDTKPVPAVVPGVQHTMRADLLGKRLLITVDGALVWHADLPAAADEFDGPPGVRSDNGTFDFRVQVPSGAAAANDCR